MASEIVEVKGFTGYTIGRLSRWKYLIIIDACRYDVFKEVIEERGLNGNLVKCQTGCHKTAWWYRRFWRRMDFDVNLISTNPVPFSSAGGWNTYRRFKTAIWADPVAESLKRYPEIAAMVDDLISQGTNLFDPLIPLSVLREVKQVGEKYLIHLMPPHLPFLGEKGRALFSKLGLDLDRVGSIYKAIGQFGQAGNWPFLRECYKENIEFALDRIEQFSDLFEDGKVVITSDHSDLIGEPNFDEKGIYRHARHTNVPELFDILQTVPWFELSERGSESS